MNTSLDDIAAYLPKIDIRPLKQVKTYQQKMQSLYGSRKFLLQTSPNGSPETLSITLYEYRKEMWRIVGNRTAGKSEQDIKKAIKSLEKKAGCKLYYVLLISTDGEYL